MDVLIIGGGVVGAVASARLARAGHNVTLLERGRLGAETTARSAAVFTWQDSQPARFEYDLKKRAWETYGPLVDDGTLDFERIGALSVATSASFATELEASASTLTEWGLDAQYVPGESLDDYGLDSNAYEGGLYSSDEGYFDPEEIVRCFADEARVAGASIEEGVAVTDLLWDGDVVVGVESSDGTVEADVVVNATGPWVHRVNAMAGVSMPVRHTRGPILVLDGDTGALPFTMFESKQYLRPVDSSGVFVGRYDTSYEGGTVLDPDEAMDEGVGDAFRAEIQSLLDRVPTLTGATVRDEWVGLRTVTPDGLPVVGPTSVPGFVVACGMNGLGVTLAPVVADTLTHALEDEPDEARSRMTPTRF